MAVVILVFLAPFNALRELGAPCAIQKAHSSAGLGGPCGVRTRDLRLERAASWAARRMGRLLRKAFYQQAEELSNFW
jgi:hypothetical protein